MSSAIADGSILDTAIDFVSERVTNINSTVSEYSGKLQLALDELATIQVADVAAPADLPAATTAEPVFDLSDPPAYADSTLTMPTVPTAIDIDSLLSDLDIADMDALPDAPATVTLTLPDAPSMGTHTAPSRPDVDTALSYPASPDLAMPTMDTLSAITLPDFVYPEFPDFTDQPPVAALTVPEPFINWAEPQYQSEMLDALQAQVREMMAGSTGMPRAVEDALFARARERDSAETNRAVQEAVDTFASRGFSMPPGMLAKQINVVREQGRLKAAETNRDILTQAAQWQIDAIRFAVQQGLALEQLTTNLYSNMVGRLFEVAKYQAESQLNVFNAQVSLFNAQSQAFANLVQVYKTKVDAANAKLQAYKTAIDAQVAIGQLNAQKVDIYKARLGAVQTSVDLFRAQMEAVKVRADVIATQFQVYRTEVDAYAQEIGAEKLKFDAYSAQVQGETAKANLLDAQARVYATTIQGLSSKADIRAKGAQLRMDAAKTRVQKYLADLDAYKAEMQASLQQVQYGVQVFQAKVEAWKATATADISAAEAQSRYADMQTRTNISYAEMQIHEYQANIQKAIQQAQVTLEAAKAMGSYCAQLAAGAMSAMHVSAGVSGSGSANSQDSTSTSTQTSYSYSY
jgi:hypothetical protein